MRYIVSDTQDGTIDAAYISLMNQMEQDGRVPYSAAMVVYTAEGEYYTTYVNMNRRDKGIAAADIQQDAVFDMIAERELDYLEADPEDMDDGGTDL